MKRWQPDWVVLGLLAAAWLAMAFTVQVRAVAQAGLVAQLPDRVGAWVGHGVRFCQNPECLREFDASLLADTTVCPVCGHRLDDKTLAENQRLPPDTVLLRKRYSRGGEPSIFVTVLFSGRDRASIHRPEICMTGQGYRIVGSAVFGIPLAGRAPLQAMGLDLERDNAGPDGMPRPDRSFFAYWFVGKGRETPYHLQRLIWMATDRVFRNVAHRWAYVSMATDRQAGSDAHLQRIREFTAELYPRLEK